MAFAHAADSILFITLDSCRYDSFAATELPNLKRIGPLHRAMAPSHFTYGSHAAMFVGFTPGVADGAPVPYINPKFARIFKMRAMGYSGRAPAYFELEGRNIAEGFRRKGLITIGTAAVGWFDPAMPTSVTLVRDFEHFYYPGQSTACLRAQLSWVNARLAEADRPVFLFINVGETHVPYYFEGAPWDWRTNPCVPFANGANNADECRRRQQACLRFIDAELAALLETFRDAATILCGDHGDCWGEDGLWEHGIAHQKVFEVPLLVRLPARSGASA